MLIWWEWVASPWPVGSRLPREFRAQGLRFKANAFGDLPEGLPEGVFGHLLILRDPPNSCTGRFSQAALKLVLSEALGDQAGIHFAYLALKKSMATHAVPAVGGFTPEQQFFLAWGQFRGEAVRIETQRQLVKGDPHAMPKFRVIGPLSNLPEFA